MSKKIWVADCETDPFKKGRIPKPFIWGVYNGTDYWEFNNTRDFVNFVTSKPIIIYAHNGGKFDWHFIMDYFDAFEPLMVIAGRLAKFKIGKCEFRDSYNILPVPLKKFSKMDFDYSILEPTERFKPENFSTIKKYLRSDCENLYKPVKQFIDRFGMNLTLASASMKELQKVEKIKVDKTTAIFYDEIQPYYYGGRTQCFKTGVFKKNLKYVDINSAYPYAMIHHHPSGDVYSIDSKLPKEINEISRCFITIECQSNGVFPFREKDGLYFYNDKEIRTYNITGWEYLAALETKQLKKYKIVKVLKFFEDITFKKFVGKYYHLKSNTKKDDYFYTFYKLILNGSYGKFASCPSRYKEFTVIDPQFIEPSNIDGWEFNALIGKWALMERPLPEEKQRFYNIAVAASITGFVRGMMVKALSKVKEPYYCDTDSIICEEYGNLKLSKELGDWELEGELKEGAIAGKKLYAFKTIEDKWKLASKGVQLKADDIYRIAKGETVEYDPEVPTFSYRKDPHFIKRNIKKTAKLC